MEDFREWGLTLAVFLPLVGAAIMMAFPKTDEQIHKVIALGTSLLVAAIGVVMLVDFDYDAANTMQWTVTHDWIDVIKTQYSVGVDGMSLPLVLLTMLITPLCIVYSLDHFPDPHNPKAFLALLLILETGMIGTFVAQDLILFFVFFEVVLLPMFFMIGVWGGEDRKYASLKFFLYTLLGSALMLVSFLALFFLADGTLAGVEANTFDMRALPEAAGAISKGSQLWVFGGMFIGFGVNIVTGDYSRGAAGFWVENGEIQYPVDEITVAGNLRDMFMGIAEVGNDMDMRGNVRTGSVLIENMTIAGA